MMGKILEPLVIVAIIVTTVYATIMSLSGMPKPEPKPYNEVDSGKWTSAQIRQFYYRDRSNDPNDELTQKIDEYMDKYLAKASEVYSLPTLEERTTVSHGFTRGKTLGIALRLNVKNKVVMMIGFHHELLKNETDEIIEEVVAHEVAHLVAYHLGGADHDDLWFKYCKTLMNSASCKESL